MSVHVHIPVSETPCMGVRVSASGRRMSVSVHKSTWSHTRVCGYIHVCERSECA